MYQLHYPIQIKFNHSIFSTKHLHLSVLCLIVRSPPSPSSRLHVNCGGGGGGRLQILNMQCDDQILINIVFVLCVTGIN
jgi:hypothetical protein